MTVIFIIGILLVLGLAVAQVNADQQSKQINEALRSIDGFNISQQVVGWDGSAIAFDDTTRKFAFLRMANKQYVTSVYHAGDILKAEIHEDGDVRTGASAKINAASKVSEVVLRITVNDTENPIQDIPFLQQALTKRSNPIYKETEKLCRHWEALFSVCINQPDSAPRTELPTVERISTEERVLVSDTKRKKRAKENPSVKSQVLSALGMCALVPCVFMVFALGYQGYEKYSVSERKRSHSKPTLAAAHVKDLTQHEKTQLFSRSMDGKKLMVDNFAVEDYTSNLAHLEVALNEFDRFHDEIEQGIGLPLYANASRELEGLFESVVKLQSDALPVLRDQYGPLAREKLRHIGSDVSAMTVGPKYRKLIMTGSMFSSPEEVNTFHRIGLEMFTKLRFNKVVYQAYKGSPSQTVIRVGDVKDSAIMKWHLSVNRDIDGRELIFSTAKHQLNSIEPAKSAASNNQNSSPIPGIDREDFDHCVSLGQSVMAEQRVSGNSSEGHSNAYDRWSLNCLFTAFPGVDSVPTSPLAWAEYAGR